MMTRLAATKLIPSPPALVDIKNKLQYLKAIKNHNLNNYYLIKLHHFSISVKSALVMLMHRTLLNNVIINVCISIC